MWKKLWQCLFPGKNSKRKKTPCTKEETVLAEFIKVGELFKAEELLVKGASANAIFYHEHLGVCDIFSKTDTFYGLCLLLRYDLNINLKDRGGETLFEAAIVNRDIRMFEKLLKDAVDPNTITSEDVGLVCYAARHTTLRGDKVFVEKLLERNIKWLKGEFPEIDKKKVYEFSLDLINGRKKLASYLVELAHKK